MHAIYRMVPLSMTLSDLWPRFQGHNIFWSRISEKTAHLKDKVTIAQEEAMPNIWTGTTLGDLDWPLNTSHGFVSISWASCMFHRGSIFALLFDYSWLFCDAGSAHSAHVPSWWPAQQPGIHCQTVCEIRLLAATTSRLTWSHCTEASSVLEVLFDDTLYKSTT